MIKQPKLWDNLLLSFWETRPTVGSELWDFLSKIESPDVLEVGCGIGTVSQLFRNYTGIDISPSAIAEAYRRYPGRLFLNANFLDLTDIELFDTVMCNQVLEHLPHFDAGLRWCLKQATRQVVISFYTGRSNITKTVYHNNHYDNYYALEEVRSAADFYGWKIVQDQDCFNGHNKAIALVLRPK